MEAVFDSDRDGILAAVQSGASPDFPASNGMTPLFWAFRAHNMDSFAFLLEAGADPDIAVSLRPQDGGRTTIIHIVAMSDDVRFIQGLLDAGADPNTIGDEINRTTALWPAVFYDRFDTIAALLEAGADINHRALGGQTPLLAAVGGQAYGMAGYLINHGADPSIANNQGRDVFDTLAMFSAPRADGPSRASYDALMEILSGRANAR